jgi:alpha-2-macroglobulin
VTLELKHVGYRYHVALVDPLPAGFEPLNPELAGTRKLPGSGNNDWYRWFISHWYEHTNLRDHRAEVFTSVLDEGTHKFSYFARATTYGTFTAPPTRAEEMYEPETFGRASTESVVVE